MLTHARIMTRIITRIRSIVNDIYDKAAPAHRLMPVGGWGTRRRPVAS